MRDSLPMSFRPCMTAIGLAAAVALPALAQEPGPESVAHRFHERTLPEGGQAGPWKITPSVTLRGGYDDNVTTVPDDEVSSGVLELRGRVDAVNETAAASYALYAEGGYAWYTDIDDYDGFEGNVGGRMNVQVSDYVRIRGAVGVAYAEDEDAATEGIVIATGFDPYVDLARYLSIPVSLGGRYDTGRWYVDASGELVYSDFEDRRTRSGLVVNQDFQTGTETNLALRGGWTFSSATSVFVEGQYNLQRYEDATADSDGWRLVAGAEFELSRLFTGEVFAGYAAQSYAAGGDEVTGLTYGGSLNWYLTQLVSMHLQARRDFGAERTAIVGGLTETLPVIRDNVSLRIEYEPLRQVLVTGSVGWQGSTYEGDDREDSRIFGSIGLEYVFTPNIAVTLDYLHEQTSSDIAGDASRNAIMLGVSGRY